MGLGRLAPHRVRAAYSQALAAIPLPVRAVSATVPETLTVLGRAEIGGRLIQFGTMAEAPRLWMAAPGVRPPVFGYLTGLVAERPILHVTDNALLTWTRQSDHTEQLKRCGLAVWHEAQRWCEG